MDWVSSKVESLTGMSEFSELDLGVRWLVQEKNGTKLIRSGFVTISILEAGLGSKSSSDSSFALGELFGPRFLEVTSEENVSGEKTDFSSSADSSSPSPTESRSSGTFRANSKMTVLKSFSESNSVAII